MPYRYDSQERLDGVGDLCALVIGSGVTAGLSENRSDLASVALVAHFFLHKGMRLHIDKNI